MTIDQQSRSGRVFARRVFAVLALMLPLLALDPGAVMAEPMELSDREKARRDRNEEYDRQNLRERDDFVVESSQEFIQIPEDADIAGEFVVAETVPTVKFQIFSHLDPEHFSEEAYQAGWANWAKVTRSDDNRFYMSASDHLGRGAQLNMYEYRPDEGVLERVLDVSDALGWHKDMWTDGKIHGRKGIMPDGTMWAGTHFGPVPRDEWYEEGYRGSWLFSFNIYTGEFVNYGVPLVRQNLAVHTLDTERGIFMGTGSRHNQILCFDIDEKRVRFAGYPPDGWIWHPRSMFLDKETGYFWGMDTSEQPYRFLSYDPELNRFKRHDVEVPANPVSGSQAILRGHTTEPDADGWYYWSTSNGAFFRFRPDWENGPEVEVIGTNWDNGRDALQLAICPDRRYIYYQPKGYPAPLVQYDIETGQKKAIAFLQDYFFEKYGYWPSSQVYGIEVSNDGSFVAIVENGTFEGRNRAFGHPGLMVVEIPEAERPVD